MTGGDLSREILISYIWVSTIPTTNELQTTVCWCSLTAVIWTVLDGCFFRWSLFGLQSVWKSTCGCDFSSNKKQDYISHTGINAYITYFWSIHNIRNMQPKWEPNKNKYGLHIQYCYHVTIICTRWRLLRVTAQSFSATKSAYSVTKINKTDW